MYGHLKYQVMPFRLSNTPASFQDYINKIFTKKLNIFVIVYLDNIFIYTGKTGKPHIEVICWVFDQLQKYGLFVNLKEYRFHSDKVQFLCYIVSVQGIQIKEDKIEAVNAWPELQSIWDIQMFLRFANFYRRFIKIFSVIKKIFYNFFTTITTKKNPTTPSALGRPACTRANKNKLSMDGGNGVGGCKIDDKIVNLSSSTKKVNS